MVVLIPSLKFCTAHSRENQRESFGFCFQISRFLVYMTLIVLNANLSWKNLRDDKSFRKSKRVQSSGVFGCIPLPAEEKLNGGPFTWLFPLMSFSANMYTLHKLLQMYRLCGPSIARELGAFNLRGRRRENNRKLCHAKSSATFYGDYPPGPLTVAVSGKLPPYVGDALIRIFIQW